MISDILGSASAADPNERADAARSLSEKCGYAAAALTILPIPLSEVVAVVPLHVGMVVGIGNIYGAEVSRESAQELLLKIGTTVGLSLVGTKLATSAAKMILPFLGGLLAAPFMYASTIAIGTIARMYYERSGELSEAEMKALYKEAFTRAKTSFDPAKAKANEAKDLASKAASEAEKTAPAEVAAEPEVTEDPVARLERLKSLLDKGLIDQGEYDEVKKRILEGI
tara:strand:+ start:548 stop:1225 length:678 start_codon:yes stop_codon:yes gene_type:complete